VRSGLAFCLSQNEPYSSTLKFLYEEGSDVEILYLQDKIAMHISVAQRQCISINCICMSEGKKQGLTPPSFP